MKTLILYYSFSGKTRELAKEKAASLSADSEEVFTVRNVSKAWAFTAGIFKSIGRKKTPVKPLESQLDGYERIILMFPVWAGHPVPMFNTVAELLPKNTPVELIMVSQSGNTGETAEKTKEFVKNLGLTIEGYTDMKTSE